VLRRFCFTRLLHALAPFLRYTGLRINQKYTRTRILKAYAAQHYFLAAGCHGRTRQELQPLFVARRWLSNEAPYDPLEGGQFALCAKALPGNPYDGHTLESVIPDMEKAIGNEISRNCGAAIRMRSLPDRRAIRILADAGYRGHNAPQSHRFRVFTSGQKRRVTPAIKRQTRRRSAIEPVIGHIKAEHRMGRNSLAGHQGDAVNAILAAAGYNFSLPPNWFRQLLWLLIAALQSQPKPIPG
jgi:hypothetical protein